MRWKIKAMAAKQTILTRQKLSNCKDEEKRKNIQSLNDQTWAKRYHSMGSRIIYVEFLSRMCESGKEKEVIKL